MRQIREVKGEVRRLGAPPEGGAGPGGRAPGPKRADLISKYIKLNSQWTQMNSSVDGIIADI